MTRRINYLLVFGVILAFVFCSGCSAIDSLFGKKADESAVKESETLGTDEVVSKTENENIKKVIIDYYKKLYKESIEKYNSTSVIPDNIKDLVAERTKTEGANNPEIGIHLPRYVELNGLTTISYEISPDINKDGIDATYISKNSGTYLYYVKISLKAKTLPYDTFNQYFKQNATTKIYEKSQTAGIDEKLTDSIRMLAKYDVELVKENGQYKILRAMEACLRPGVQNRMMLVNNDSYQRLPFINIDKDVNGKSYINSEDGKRFDAERAVIEEWFNNLKNLDNERMNLFRTKWNNGQTEFSDFLTKVLKVNASKNGKELIEIGADYNIKFPYESFPLQAGMSKIDKYTGFSVIPHPAYTKNQKKYIVNFDATLEKLNGVIGQKWKFKYDYFVTLTSQADNIKISSMELNNCSFVQLTENKPKTEEEAKNDDLKE